MGYVYLGLFTLVFARVYLMHLELHKLIKSESQKTRDEIINKFCFLYNVSDTVIYDNFGTDFKMPKEVYKISEIVKDGYLICNVYTKPFFAYGYQLRTYR